ncbi:MAG TPA: hypothetical protein VGO07_02920 [Candidatus Saccharimonadales bacterium]|jgi:hypothetical protein|nr:hypothetical protein [Candidatus Saccharimonadales bacterium]
MLKLSWILDAGDLQCSCADQVRAQQAGSKTSVSVRRPDSILQRDKYDPTIALFCDLIYLKNFQKDKSHPIRMAFV